MVNVYICTDFLEFLYFPAQAKLKLVVAESARRKCFNELQELKGNIRVFARIRPTSRRASHDEGTCPIVLDSDTGTHSQKKSPQKNHLSNYVGSRHRHTFCKKERSAHFGLSPRNLLGH
jgi:hypothetical protein